MIRMTRRRTAGFLAGVGLVLIAGLGGWWWSQRSTAPAAQPSSTDSSAETPAAQQKPDAPAPMAAAPSEGQPAGYYGDYTDDRLKQSYDKTILFFHATWCSECRAFDQAIKSGRVPAGVQILKVDYDRRTDLRQKYDVRIQSTFVELDDDDDQHTGYDSWVGYGKDKSIQAILEHL